MSTDETRKLELIQGDLDGDLSATDRAELARLLLQDPEARRVRDELARTDAMLRALPPAEPPAGLRPSILSALGLASGGAEGTGSGAAAWGRYRLAAAVLGGLVVVGLGYRLVSTQEDLDGLQGSIAAGAVATAPADEVVIAVGGGHVTARLFREGTRTRLTLESSGLEPIEVIGQYDPTVLAPAGAAAAGPGSRAGQFGAVLQAADPSESLEFTGTGPIRLEIRAGGQRLDTVVLGADAPD